MPETESDAGAPEVVDSLLHPEAATIRALLKRSGRADGGGRILIDDEENILRAIRAGLVIHSVFGSSDRRISERLSRALSPAVRRFELARRTCKKIFENDKMSRTFAIAEAPRPQAPEVLLATGRDIVVLDGLSIAGNIGAIIRTSLAMNVGGIVLLDAAREDVFDRRVIRASRGCLFELLVATATSEEMVRFCGVHDVPLVVMVPGAGAPMSDMASLPRPLALVYGGEKEGCSQVLREAAAYRVEIPMSGAVQSLNVAAAAAITLYCRYEFNASRQSC